MAAPTLMIVEDEIILAMELEQKLGEMGYAVVGRVTSGEEAVRKAAEWLPELVVMDIRLDGGIDGIETAKLLRDTYHIPAIYLTAYTDERTLQRAKLSEPFGYLVKPYSERELRTTIEMALHKSRMEERLRESEERFRAVFESAEDFVFVKDHNLRYVDINPAMLKQLGVQKSKVVGRTDEDLFAPDEAGQLRRLETRILEGQTVTVEHTARWADQVITCSFARVPLRNARGDVTGMCGIGRDITERKRQERDFDASGLEHLDDDCISSAMQTTLRQVRLAAQTDSFCLFLGESGSGKDYLARYLHDASQRNSGPFFSINCAALTPELAESELFGHERGAFTGAMGRKRGLLELAESGTLLLNEIGELSLKLQAKLLTFLDTKSFTRVGGEKNISVNARLVAATNRDIEDEVATGKFRRDLYYRINVITVRVPPLRERRDDIPALVRRSLEALVKRMGQRDVPSIAPEAMALLQGYAWPGNVRELRNVLERALIHSVGNRITSTEISLDPRAMEQSAESSLSFTLNVAQGRNFQDEITEAKRYFVSEGLRRANGSVTAAAALLGITRDALNYLIKSLKISRPSGDGGD